MGSDSEAFSFIAYGDTRSDGLPDSVGSLHGDLVNAFLQNDPEFVIHTGDMVLAGGLEYQWTGFNDSIRPMIDAGVPIYGAAGNHEKYTDDWDVHDVNLSYYQAYFDYSSVVDEPGETELYYSYDYGGVHFIFLNTEDYFNEGSKQYTCSTPQMNWLQSDLSTTVPDDFIVVTFHRTAWSIRKNRSDRWSEAASVRDDFHDLFVQNGVDLVLMGHDHYYYQTLRNGVRYVTTGGGGAPLADVDISAPIWQSGDVAFSEYHYCLVDVDPVNVNLTAVRIDGTVIDAFTVAHMRQNIPPVASFSYTPGDPSTGEHVQFIDESYDPDGLVNQWLWDLGDGANSTDPSPTHIYGTFGEKTVTLNVTDNSGDTHTVTYTFNVSKPAEFNVSDLKIIPDSVDADENVTVSAVCTNTGGKNGSHSITLELDGVPVDEKNVSLQAGENVTVSFKVSSSDEGEHTVTVDRLSGIFNVEKGLLDFIPGFPTVSLILGLMVLVLLYRYGFSSAQ